MRITETSDGRKQTRIACDVDLGLHQAARMNKIPLGSAFERGVCEILREKGIQND